ncbi:hypothetical protein Bca4012_003730 [Brassica carinata]
MKYTCGIVESTQYSSTLHTATPLLREAPVISEPTSSSAPRLTTSIRATIDGLNPLIKETILEFSTGEETILTLEYDNLANHCSACNRLTHETRECPLNREQASRTHTPQPSPQTGDSYICTPPITYKEIQTLLRAAISKGDAITTRQPNRHLQEQPWPADSHTYRRNRTNQEHSPPGHGEEQLVEHHQVSKRRTDSRRRSLRCEPMEVEKPKIESLKPTEPIGNGLDFEKYSWTQNLQEVTVTIPVPSGTKSRSVACEIKKSRLRVGLKGQEPIIDGEFFNAVKPDDCFWNIEDQKFISVLLTKQDQMQWWKYCLKGEPEIDTQKVELESSKLSDLDPETEAALRR